MPYAYQAEIFCDACGRTIREELDKQGKTPEGRDFDSDDYPKHGDEEETDCPQHCGSGAECEEVILLPSGRKVGALIGDQLTESGNDYVRRAALDSPSEVTSLWIHHFAIDVSVLNCGWSIRSSIANSAAARRPV